MKLKGLSVFFPAFNEQNNISKTVERAIATIPSFAESFEMIVVNDGSRDNTSVELDRLAKRYSSLRIITHDCNRGYGAALKSGFANSRFDHIFYTDGDGQFDTADIGKLVSVIDGCDIAAGVRVKRQDNFYRIVNAKLYNLLVRMLFGLKVDDIDCAFKLLRAEVVKTISLQSEGAFINAELLIKARKKGFVIKQVGVQHLPREIGKSSGNNLFVVLKAFMELSKLWKELKS